LRSSLAPGESRRVERVLASTRLFLASSFLAAIYIVPTEPGRYPTLVYVLLGLYIIHSFIVMFLARVRVRPSTNFQFFVHSADVVWPAIVSLFTRDAISPFFLFFLFVLLAAAYRWGLWETLATALASIALLVGEHFVLTHWRGLPAAWGMQSELNRLFLSSAYLVAMGLLIGYLAENEKQLRAEKAVLTRVVGGIRVEHGLTGNLQEILQELLHLFGGSEAIVAVEETHSERVFACEAKFLRTGVTEIRWLGPSELKREAYLFSTPAHTWFAECRRRSIGLLGLDSSGMRLRKLDAAFIAPLQAERTFNSVVGVTLATTDEWSGRLFLFDPSLPRDREEALRFLQDLVRQAGPAVSNVYLLRRLRQRAGAIERARVARELHDGAVQSLISVEMQVDVLRRHAPEQPERLPSELGRIQQLLREEVLKLRDLMQQMKPLAVDAKTLAAFLEDTVSKFQRETGISARFVCDDDDLQLPARACRELARIVQEGLINVRKHSGARHVLVRLNSKNGTHQLVIEDDGHGFEFSGRLTHAELEARHKGPTVIRERVRSINGELTVESVPGRGARLEIAVAQQQYAAYA
jgi:signal transduction histidine kinase